MPRETNRREFIKQASALVGTGVFASLSSRTCDSLQGAEKKGKQATGGRIRIADTHQHLWDLRKFNLPWLKNQRVQAINRSYLMSDYLKATNGLNVVKTVYMEVNVHRSQQTAEAQYVIDLCKHKDNPMAAAVIGGYPHEREFKEHITKFSESPHVKGVRTVLHDPDRPKGLCLRPQFVESMKLLGELGLSFDLCMRPDEIVDGVRLAEKCPKTRFIIDHCGNMSVRSTDKKLRATWMQGMKAAAGLENIVCKISGIIVTAKQGAWKPDDLAANMNFCMETFGEHRVFFGGDWPVCTLRATFKQWVDALKHIVRDRSPAFKRKLFHDNAVKFYGLS